MVNTLTGTAGLKLGPVVLETLVKHFFERIERDRQGKSKPGSDTVQLRKDELLYDEAFNIIKTFLESSQRHTVEELQGFSNARTPTPPWVHLVRLVIPMSCCDKAANYLIKALGGEEVCKRVIGGTKWWQVRGVKGVDAEWITSQKDYQEHKKRSKARERQREESTDGEPKSPEPTAGFTHGTSDANGAAQQGDYDTASYQPEMDAMRCILYSHGGGYYFGSVDQERYSIQRYARKINGRVFAVNYRLAPQYPFPCAIHDLLTAYIFLIRPPEEASHQPVKPEHIVVAGDSAGGGLTIALLQVIRDSGLPLPAGGVLISPWCDLTHSFPSIHVNTATDIIPPYGLSLHKPSILWPPPPDDLTGRVHEGLRSRIRRVVHRETSGSIKANGSAPRHVTPRPSISQLHVPSPTSGPGSNEGHEAPQTIRLPSDGGNLRVGSSAALPTADSTSSTTVTLQTDSGDTLTIADQIQLYCPNNLATHPLVSPALSYLGGLPPLLFVISDKEVLRDEGIYTAHLAAHPEKHPVKDAARHLYPALEGIESRYGPTRVHLQVYDDAAHVLPVLFAFTTPAKFCYRAIASFCKYTTGMLGTSTSSPQSSQNGSRDSPSKAPTSLVRTSTFAGLGLGRRPSRARIFFSRSVSLVDVGVANAYRENSENGLPDVAPVPKSADDRLPRGTSLKRAMSTKIARAASLMRRQSVAQGEDGERKVVVSAEPESYEPSASSATTTRTEMPVTPGKQEPGRDDQGIASEQPVKSVTTEEPSSDQGESIVADVEATAEQIGQPGDADGQVTQEKVQEQTQTQGGASAKTGSTDVAGPRFESREREPSTSLGLLHAGDAVIYIGSPGAPPWTGNMIRERISTQGVVRQLEPESELGAMNVPPELLGAVSELAARRYIDGRGKWDERFARASKRIAKERRKQLELARKDTTRTLEQLQMVLHQDQDVGGSTKGKKKEKEQGEEKHVKDAVLAVTGSWTWAWALDADERPPPSSIAARRDTQEARRLARIADQHVMNDGAKMMTGNNLWSLLIDFLTVSPDKKPRSKSQDGHGRTRSGFRHRLLSRSRHDRSRSSAPTGKELGDGPSREDNESR